MSEIELEIHDQLNEYAKEIKELKNALLNLKTKIEPVYDGNDNELTSYWEGYWDAKKETNKEIDEALKISSGEK